MKYFLTLALLAAIATPPALNQSKPDDRSGPSLSGRWRVKFSLSGVEDKNLIFEVKAKGAGTFLFLDTAPDNKPLPEPVPAVWSEITNGRVSFSGNVELPLGTCCREVGTLILKGTFASETSIKGRAIFIASTIDEENFNGFRSTVGAFTASREP